MTYAEVGRRKTRRGMGATRIACLISSIMILASLATLAAQPVITGVTIPNVSMKISDVVTATISVQSDSATVYDLNASTIGGYALSNRVKLDSTTYTAQFTVTSGGTDYAAGTDIPTNVTLADGGFTDTWSTAISQANDPIDANRPDVTINQAGGQTDPTNASPVVFTAVFDEAINDATFTNADVNVGGTATTGTVTATEIAPNDDTTFSISIVVTADGTVVPTIPAGGVEDPAGNTNNVSTSTDNTVTVETVKPDVTIDQAGGQADPTNMSPVLFTAVFDEPINDATFTNANVSVGGTATTGTVTVTEIAPNDDTTFSVSIVVTADGTVVPTIPAGGVEDPAGNTNTVSTSTDNSVSVDTDPAGVDDVEVDTGVMYEGDLVQQVTVSFDEAMDTATDPTITFGAGTFASNSDGAWSVGDTVWIATYTLTDNNEDIAVVTVDVTGSKDAAGNGQDAYGEVDEFDIDTLAPTVTSITRDDANPTRATQVYIQVDFSEDVNGITFANFSIDATGGQATASIDSTGGADAVWWVLVNTVDDATGTLSVDLDSNLSSITDDAGNELAVAYTAGEAYDVDRLDPTVTSVSASDSLISDSDAGSTFTVTVNFSEPMDDDGSDDPTITLDPTVIFTLTLASPGWVNDQQYKVDYLVVDADKDVSSVTIDVTNAKDALGNAQSNYTPEHEFAVDTYNPSVVSVVVDTDPAYESDLVQLVTVTFDEAMLDDASEDPVISFGAGTWASNSDGVYNGADTIWTETFTLTDNNEEIAVVTVDVTGAKDAVGNDQQAYTPEDEFDIDTVKPSVLTVAVDTDPTYESDLTQQVTVTFDEAMDTGTDPTITFGAGTFATNSDGGWTIGNTVWTETFTLTDNNEEIAVVTVDVTGAKDAAGNAQEPYAAVDEFDIDTVKPSVNTVAVDTDPMYESDLTQVVTVTFDEAMGTGTDPTITFGAGTFASNSDGAWSGVDTVWTETFTLTDNDQEIMVVTVDVTGAVDAAGNAQEPYAAVDEFDIDTVKPSVSTVVADTDPVYEGDLTQLVTVTFDEVMLDDASADPVISFSAGTWASNSDGAYNGADTVWTETFTLTDNDEEIAVVTIDVTNAKDAAGNDQEPYAAVDEFDIDTVKPSVLTVVVDTDPMYESDLTQQVTVTFDEAMDTGTAPTITFGAGTFASNSDGGWTVGNTVWTETFTLIDNNEEIAVVTVDVTGAKDAAGNNQEPYAEVDEFDIDTVKPAVLTVAADTDPMYESDLTQQVTVTFDEAMGTGTDPTITFGAGTFASNSDGGWSVGNTVWTESFTLTNNNEEIAVVTVDVTNAKDAAGNNQEPYAEVDEFDIDTVKPEVVLITIEDYPTRCGGARICGTNDPVDGFFDLVIEFSEAVSLAGTLDVGLNFVVQKYVSFSSGEISWAAAVPPTTPSPPEMWNNRRYSVTYTIVDGDNSCLLDVSASEGVMLRAGATLVDGAGNTIADGPAPHDLSDQPSQTIADFYSVTIDTEEPTANNDPDGLTNYAFLESGYLAMQEIVDGKLRIVLREDTAIYIDVLSNDPDNCPQGRHVLDPSRWAAYSDLLATPAGLLGKTPEYGRVEVFAGSYPLRASGCEATVIRYISPRDYTGPDEFNYVMEDCSGNWRVASVDVYVVAKNVLFSTIPNSFSGIPTFFRVETMDEMLLRVADEGRFAFGFSIPEATEHGVLMWREADVVHNYELGIAALDLTYTSADGFEGRDTFTWAVVDPFGVVQEKTEAFMVVRPDTSVLAATPAMTLTQGAVAHLAVPLRLFDAGGIESIRIQVLGPLGDVAFEMNEQAVIEAIAPTPAYGAGVMSLDTAALPTGTLQLLIPIGDGSICPVVVRIQGGDGE